MNIIEIEWERVERVVLLQDRFQ